MCGVLFPSRPLDSLLFFPPPADAVIDGSLSGEMFPVSSHGPFPITMAQWDDGRGRSS